jgi:hypothetical protein
VDATGRHNLSDADAGALQVQKYVLHDRDTFSFMLRAEAWNRCGFHHVLPI